MTKEATITYLEMNSKMDNTKPLISVIIPVYNTKNYLEKCLDSVLNQTYENLEVIIVDDGSTDGSEAMCDEYAQRDSRVKVIHKENGGQCTARNVGLDMATGDYFAFVDSDDWIDERMYETLMTNALKYGCDLSTCVNTDTKNPDGRLEIVEQPEIMKAHLLGQKGVCQSPCNKIFKRELFDGIRFFKMRAYEDCATLHFVLARANKAVFQNEIMYYYVKRENSTMTQSFSPVKFKSIEAYKIMLDHYEEKFPQARTLYMYMAVHPGKMLNFMGNEFGQLREWDEKREQDWDILKYPVHDSFSGYMKDLCFVYRNNPALFELDYEQDGFKWVDCHQEEKCIYVFERLGKKQRILAIFNFSDKRQTYQLEMKNYKVLKLLLASDSEIYGGCKKYQKDTSVRLVKGNVKIEINAFTGLMYEII